MKTHSKINLILLFLFISTFAFAQEIEVEPEVEQVPSLITNNDTLQMSEQDTSKTKDTSEIFVSVTDAPEFTGGDEARIKYLQNNIHYPEKAKEIGAQGTVYVTFVVEADGRITNVKILKGVCPSIDKEAMRVTKKMPKWKPGKVKGKPVRAQFNMPLRFVLSGNGDPEPLTKKEKKALKKKQKKEAKIRQKSSKK